MKRLKKLLLTIPIISFIVLAQVTPTFASVDGAIRCVKVDGLYMRTGPSTNYSIIMMMAKNEAYAVSGYSGNWDSAIGWDSTLGSVVSGWVAQGYATSAGITAKYDLSMYTSESDSSYYADIPAGARFNANAGDYTYSNLYYFGVVTYVDGTGAHSVPNGLAFVHTNFRTSSPSNYYLTLNPY